ncbi:MAG: hypothetical protein HY668_00925 [Chloroflexi bacterium]|nr:hypothetical protein [Chloroflexota bacterium]
MPSVFKTLASITVWILFIFGCLSLLAGFVRLAGASGSSLPLIAAYFGYGIISLTLSVVTAKLRQMLE